MIDVKQQKGAAPTLEPILLTIRDVARLLSLTDYQVKALVARGELPAVKLGASWRLKAADVRAYVEALRPVGKA